MLSDGGQEHLLPVDRLSRENSVSSESELIGQDLWKQLKRLFQHFLGINELIKIGKLPLCHVLTGLQLWLNTSCCSFDNASLERFLSQSRILVIPQRPVKPLKIVWKGSLADRGGRLPCT